MNATDRTLHAHIDTESRDRDGRYSYSNIIIAGKGITPKAFKFERLSLYLPLLYTDEENSVTFKVDGFDFVVKTEEGYHAVTVTLCTDNDADEHNTFRDHSAEAMGY